MVAAWWGLRDKRLLASPAADQRLGVVRQRARNSVLVALTARPNGVSGLSNVAHEVIGLVALGAVMVGVVFWMKREPA